MYSSIAASIHTPRMPSRSKTPRRRPRSPEPSHFDDADEETQAPHIPVLLPQVIAGLMVRPGGRYIDATVGAGGHSLAIVQAAEGVQLLGLDTDPGALEIARSRLKTFIEMGQVRLARTNFEHMAEIARAEGFGSVSGVLMDLGVSSMQLDRPERGFSFRADGPLDMRLDPTAGPTAADLVNSLPEEELAGILYKYGEEHASRRIARRIVEERSREPLLTTGRLASVVSSAMGGKVPGRTRSFIHPATKTFQALRIAVNRELDVLQTGLESALSLLKPGGRLAIISFHSLEDRTVKLFLRREAKGCICPPELPVCICGRKPTLRAINSKPLEADEAELSVNPRSRSARLRVAERLEGN